MSADGAGKFGSCCEVLKDVLESDEVDPEKEDDPNMVDHPVFFCPFCGAKLQTPEEVDAKGKT
jgi:hypothetical protein